MPTETTLKGIDNLGDYSFSEILEHNLIAFFDWGFLNKNGFINVHIPSSGAYGGDFSKLRPVNDPRFSSGKVWESAVGNWVWESGLDNSQPISISGVFVNNTFLPASGNSFYIDYPNGRIVFNSGIATTSTVRIEHSHKYVNVTSTNNIPWLRKTQERSYRVDDSNFLIGSGEFGGLRENKIQLPFVAVEISEQEYEGYQIGGGQWCRTRVKFFVVGEDKASVERLSHIISSQKDKTIYTYDSNLVARNSAFPLDYKGSLTSNAKTYPKLTELSGDGGYRYINGLQHGKVAFIDSQVQTTQQLTSNVWQRVVTLYTEGVLTKI